MVLSNLSKADLFLKVSFYRGEVPESIPEEITRRRKGPDSHWLATLPIKLPVSVIHKEKLTSAALGLLFFFLLALPVGKCLACTLLFM